MKTPLPLLLSALALSVLTPFTHAATVPATNSPTAPVVVTRFSPEVLLRRNMAHLLSRLQHRQLRDAQRTTNATLRAIRSDVSSELEQNVTAIRTATVTPVS